MAVTPLGAEAGDEANAKREAYMGGKPKRRARLPNKFSHHSIIDHPAVRVVIKPGRCRKGKPIIEVEIEGDGHAKIDTRRNRS